MKTIRSRRDFLKLSAAGAAGAFVISQTSCKFGGKPTADAAAATAVADKKSFGAGLQLYTIRDAMGVDVPGSLKKVSDAGYKYVELAGYADGKFYNMVPEDFKKLVNDLGMEILSSHTQVEAQGITLDNAKKMAEDHARLEVKYCIQPWVVQEARKTVASYQKMVADWNQVGSIMKEHGIMFGYHNHNFEFDNVEGKIPYFDIFMTELDKNLVTMELDIFWVAKAGQSVVDIIKRYPGWFQLFHMKDMYTSEAPYFSTDGVRDFAPVGEGVINFKEILDVKDIAGMKYLVVEQDLSRDGDPFGDINKSITNMTTKILV
ncbi:MAG: TIM barrel protein [Bacteroidales bacterium]|jgi:sugar phosphate isomerase/epimerase|nr:TIM barrel protein [Bacteroidales bacterium]